jgi:uncharacterized protein (DUF1015 family)
MVVLRPFRGWRYDPDVVGDPASVLCPPYDLITPEMQASLRQTSPYNVVHLEAGEGLDWDNPAHDQYSDTASLFREWTGKGVLRRDTEPSYYLSRQVFLHQGTKCTRLGLTACVGLAPYDSGQVLPHEYTESPAVRDRVSLMKACNANFSPIMALYRDAEGVLPALFQKVMSGPPVLDVDDGLGLRATLWQIASASLSEPISRFFQDKAIFLADGHHRYEAALQFQGDKLGSGGTGPSQADNFVMMTLIGFDDPGLLVLPYHRLLGGLSPDKYSEVRQALSGIFDSTPILNGKPVDAESVAQEVAGRGLDRHAIGMVGPAGEAPVLLTLRQGVDWRNWGPLAVSEAWILEERVLKPVLGDTTLSHLGYIHDHHEAVESVISGGRQLAFLLKPFPIAQFETVVSQGQRLPRKSTFFYPKLPTGLVINQLEGTL